LREELAIEIDVGRELPAVTHDYGDAVILLRAFLCRLRDGEPRPQEHVAVRWCAPHEAAALDLAEADRPVLAFYLQHLRDSACARACQALPPVSPGASASRPPTTDTEKAPA
jgi:8-oxo-dGTP pyrophosphatase MutT (NUDIX family)